MVIFKEPGKGQFFLLDVQSLGNSGPLSSSADSTARMLWVFRVGCGDKRIECAFKNEGKIKQTEDGSLSNLKQEIHFVESQKEESGLHPLIQ